MSGKALLKTIRGFALGAGLTLLTAPSGGLERLTDSPFGYGEDVPDLVASCEDIRGWAEKAPQTDMRISLAIRGKLRRVHSDGALVYLSMCAEPHPKVTCITYQANGMGAGDVVTFAGGYRQLADGRVLLDPCLASRR